MKALWGLRRTHRARRRYATGLAQTPAAVRRINP